MYVVSYNLKRLFRWISYTTNRKWRINGKNVGKIKVWILWMDVINGGGGGVHKLTSKERFPSPISNFESPLMIFHSGLEDLLIL